MPRVFARFQKASPKIPLPIDDGTKCDTEEIVSSLGLALSAYDDKEEEQPIVDALLVIPRRIDRCSRSKIYSTSIQRTAASV
jgi:hypothetical protein